MIIDGIYQYLRGLRDAEVKFTAFLKNKSGRELVLEVVVRDDFIGAEVWGDGVVANRIEVPFGDPCCFDLIDEMVNAC